MILLTPCREHSPSNSEVHGSESGHCGAKRVARQNESVPRILQVGSLDNGKGRRLDILPGREEARVYVTASALSEGHKGEDEVGNPVSCAVRATEGHHDFLSHIVECYEALQVKYGVSPIVEASMP